MEAAALTATGLLTGTAAWMSPEQALGKPVTPASDMFSLGSLVYYAATGKAPFGTGQAPSVLYAVVHDEPDLTALTDPTLRTIAASCLTKNPTGRPDTTTLASLLDTPDSRGTRQADDTPPVLVPPTLTHTPRTTPDSGLHDHATVIAPEPRLDHDATHGPRPSPDTLAIPGSPPDSHVTVVGEHRKEPSPPPRVPSRQRGRRRPLLLTVAGVAVLALVMGIGIGALLRGATDTPQAVGVGSTTTTTTTTKVPTVFDFPVGTCLDSLPYPSRMNPSIPHQVGCDGATAFRSRRLDTTATLESDCKGWFVHLVLHDNQPSCFFVPPRPGYCYLYYVQPEGAWELASSTPFACTESPGANNRTKGPKSGETMRRLELVSIADAPGQCASNTLETSLPGTEPLMYWCYRLY